MRRRKPFIFANVRSHEGVDQIINWIKSDVLLEDLKIIQGEKIWKTHRKTIMLRLVF